MQIGNCALGWKNYTRGRPREIVEAGQNGYRWRYLGDSDNDVRDALAIDPYFQLPGWGMAETLPQQTDAEKMLAIIDTQAQEIIRLRELVAKLEAKIRALGGTTL